MSKLFVYILISLITLNNFAQSEEKVQLNKGVEAYKNGNFALALEEFNNGYKSNSAYKKALFNAGNAALLNDSTSIAKDLFSEYVSVAENKIERNKGYYNLGNVQYKEYEALTKDPKKSKESIKVLKESIDSYKNALRNNPKDSDARHNLKLAMSKVPPPNENEDNQDDQNNENQENQDEKEDQQKNEENKDENKEGQDKEGENKEDGEKGENKEDQKGDKGDEEKEGEGENGEEKEQDKQEENQQKGNKGEESKEKGEEEMNGQISRMQAAKDLDALNNDEQKTLMKVNRKKGDQKKQNSSSKDW